MKKNKDTYMSAIESLLFFWGDSLDLDSLSKILEIDKKIIISIIEELDQKYQDPKSGIELKKINESYQLVTKSINHEYIQQLTTKEDNKSLSNSLMEVLSIIAYKQPVTRVEIDEIRGVNSSSSINTLLNRNLITELGRLDQIGKPIIYGTTEEFLRVFALENIKALPKEDEFESIKKID